MISGEDLVRMLAEPGGLVVTPIIDPDTQLGVASIDIRLGPDIIVARRATGATSFDPSDSRAFRDALQRRQTYVRRGIGDPFHLQPGEFVIARSLEYVQLPDDVRAQALGRSSWGRLGLVVATATLIQPGFRGTITLELANLGNTPIVLEVGLPIAQLTFTRDGESGSKAKSKSKAKKKAQAHSQAEKRAAKWWKGSKARRKPSRYADQLRPELSRLDQDRDLWWVAPTAVKYVLGVVGDRFAGKSTVVNFLISRRNFRIYRLARFVYDEALRRGEDISDHDVLRRVGDQMREEGGDDVLARLAFAKIRADMMDPDRRRAPTAIVIEGFKVPEELEAWQQIDAFKTVVVNTSAHARLERALHAGFLQEERAIEKVPPKKDPEARIDWLRRYVDEPEDGRHLVGPVITQAEQEEGRLVLPNDLGISELSKRLSAAVPSLDGWARQRPF